MTDTQMLESLRKQRENLWNIITRAQNLCDVWAKTKVSDDPYQAEADLQLRAAAADMRIILSDQKAAFENITLIRPLAYQGKNDCLDARCTQYWPDGVYPGHCYGWHCATCDKPSSSQGDGCAKKYDTRRG